MNLTPDQERLKIEIEVCENMLITLHRTRAELNCSCKTHVLRDLDQNELDDEWMSVGAYCVICRKDFGWRCKKSPDSVCHYHTVDDHVKLIDGTLLKHPGEAYESSDQCLFCGLPDERK